MIEFRRILFPTDFSPYADEAKQYACDLVSQFQAELYLLHVIDDIYAEVPTFGMGLSFPGFVDNVPKHRAKLNAEATKLLSEQVGSEFQESNRVITATRFGAPFHEIIKYAQEHSADMIVMGTHGRTGIRHMLIGSVAERVVRKAKCPVLTVRPKAWGEELQL
jgi:universal stress protein A